MGAGLDEARFVAGVVGGGGPEHEEDATVGEFLYPVGGRGEHALAANEFHQSRAEDVEPIQFVDFVEAVSDSCLQFAPETKEPAAYLSVKLWAEAWVTP